MKSQGYKWQFRARPLFVTVFFVAMMLVDPRWSIFLLAFVVLTILAQLSSYSVLIDERTVQVRSLFSRHSVEFTQIDRVTGSYMWTFGWYVILHTGTSKVWVPVALFRNERELAWALPQRAALHGARLDHRELNQVYRS